MDHVNEIGPVRIPRESRNGQAAYHAEWDTEEAADNGVVAVTRIERVARGL